MIIYEAKHWKDVIHLPLTTLCTCTKTYALCVFVYLCGATLENSLLRKRVNT